MINFQIWVTALLENRDNDNQSNAEAKCMNPQDLKWRLYWSVEISPVSNIINNSEENYIDDYCKRCRVVLKAGYRRYWTSPVFEEIPKDIKNVVKNIYQRSHK